MTAIEAFVRPYDRGHDLYQQYYRASLKAYARREHAQFEERGARARAVLRLLRRVRHSYQLSRRIPGLRHQRLLDAVATGLGHDGIEDVFVGEYLFKTTRSSVRVTIDTADSGEVSNPDIAAGVDVYFKTNYWPSRQYQSNVRPLPNLNPLVLEAIPRFRRSRAAGKTYDLFAFFRVWGGRDEVEGVEHNLQLFEVLSKVPCRKFLLAYLVAGDTRMAKRRLERAGIPWTETPMRRSRLWDLAASARLSVVRHGMHQCIPWRMTETLAMGGCPVMDYSPQTIWPVPLRENQHYLTLRRPFAPGEPTRDAAETVDDIMTWLSQPDLLADMASSTARYFDDHLAPERFGRFIVTSAIAATTDAAAGAGGQSF